MNLGQLPGWADGLGSRSDQSMVSIRIDADASERGLGERASQRLALGACEQVRAEGVGQAAGVGVVSVRAGEQRRLGLRDTGEDLVAGR